MRIAAVLSLLVLAGCASAPRYPHLTPQYDLVIEGAVIGVHPEDDRPHPHSQSLEPRFQKFLWKSEIYVLRVDHVDGNTTGISLSPGHTLNLSCLASENGYWDPGDGSEPLVMNISIPPRIPCLEVGMEGLFGFQMLYGELVPAYFGDPKTRRDEEYRLNAEAELQELGTISEE